MYNDELKQQLQAFFAGKKSVVIVQGDNPDGDSLASSLALESLLHAVGIEAFQYCSIDVAQHLRHLSGWDRVSTELPNDFDGWILVDCEYLRLLDNAKAAGALQRLMTRPLLILDHHASPSDIDFAELVVNDPRSGATGQVIYYIATLLGWDIPRNAAEFIVSSILSDTLGFNSEFLNGNSSPLVVVAELVNRGVNLAELNERRLNRLKISPEIFRYKAELMKRVEFHYDNRIATIDIPHDEIKEFSMDYNPTVVLDETRMVEGLAVTIGFKSYEKDGRTYKITGRIRCGYGYQFANTLAAHFRDGGGHPYAAGFKIEGSDLSLSDVKKQAIEKAIELIPSQTSY